MGISISGIIPPSRRPQVIQEVRRKSIHIIPGVLGPPIVLTLDRLSALVALFFLVLYALEEARLRLNLGFRVPIASRTFEIMAREEERERRMFTGTIYFWGSTFFLLALSIFDLRVALAAIMISSFGDAAAAIVGKAFGRTPIPYCRRRTLEGSAAFIIVSLLTTAPIVGLELALIGALVGAVMESLPLHYTLDELTVPIGSALAMQLALRMTA